MNEAAETKETKKTIKRRKKSILKRGWFWFALIALGALVYFVALPALAPAQPVVAAAPPTTPLEKQTLENAILYSGTVYSKDVTNIYAPSSLKVKEIKKDVGDTVRAGDVLAVLDTDDLVSEIAQAELNIKGAQSSLSNEKKTNANSRKSAGNSVTTARQTLDQAQRDYDKAVADNGATEIRTAELNVEAAQRDYSSAATSDPSVDSAMRSHESAQDSLAATVADRSSITSAESARDIAEAAYNAVKDIPDHPNLQKLYNDWVAKGTAAANAETAYQSRCNSARNEVERTYRAYQDAVDNAAASLETKKDALEKAEMAYGDAQITTADGIQAAKDKLEAAKISYENALNSRELTNYKDTASSAIGIEIQEMQLENLNEQLVEATIVATAGGTVTYSNITVGAAVSGLLYVIEDTENLKILTSVGEYDIGSVALGQDAVITLDSTGDSEFRGAVTQIAPTAVKDTAGETTATTNVEFETEVSVVEFDPRIRVGMNAQVRIITQSKEDVWAVPFDALHTEGDRSYILVLENGQPRQITVEKGMETDAYIEVISGELQAGMQVVTSAAAPGAASGGMQGGGFMMMGGPGGGGRNGG